MVLQAQLAEFQERQESPATHTLLQYIFFASSAMPSQILLLRPLNCTVEFLTPHYPNRTSVLIHPFYFETCYTAASQKFPSVPELLLAPRDTSMHFNPSLLRAFSTTVSTNIPLADPFSSKTILKPGEKLERVFLNEYVLLKC